jgi:lysophospholipase L1-like esterase
MRSHLRRLLLTILALSLPLHAEDTSNSAIAPVPESGMEQRHADKAAAAAKHKYDLLVIGDSITANLEKPVSKAVWDQFYAARNALDLGYSGARTENILWNLQNGELQGQTPKVAVLLIGTNNSDDANYPVVHTPEQIAAGVSAIVHLLREKTPETKILLLRIFPREKVYKKPDGSVRGDARKCAETNLRASELFEHLADGQHVFFLDVDHVFQRLDGSIDPQLMPDLLHPSPDGAMAWAKAMEPTLCELFGDQSHDTPPTNTAIVPVSKLENDFYDWQARHEAVLKTKDQINPEIVLLGDSITHLWGGLPTWQGRGPNGAKSFEETFGGQRVLNLGFGWDRTQNVLWRLDHGEFDGLHPKLVVLNIGTNNYSATKNARANTSEEIADGVREILIRLRSKSPSSHIVLMGVFPCGEKPENPKRKAIVSLNALLSEFGKTPGITFLDIGSKLTQPDGTISRETMADFLHPTEAGYRIWGEALKPYLAEISK